MIPIEKNTDWLKMDNKGNISLEIAIILIILILITGIALSLSETGNQKAVRNMVNEHDELLVESVVDNLINNPGNTHDWEGYEKGMAGLAIVNGEGETVGIVDITDFDAKNCRAEVGIVVACSHRRQGYALSAIRQIIDYALHVLHLHQLYAVVSSSNEAALGLFRKAGFIECSELKDWLYDGKNYQSAVLMQIFL